MFQVKWVNESSKPYWTHYFCLIFFMKAISVQEKSAWVDVNICSWHLFDQDFLNFVQMFYIRLAIDFHWNLYHFLKWVHLNKINKFYIYCLITLSPNDKKFSINIVDVKMSGQKNVYRTMSHSSIRILLICLHHNWFEFKFQNFPCRIKNI